MPVFTLDELASKLEATLIGDASPSTVITKIASLSDAKSGDITFLVNPKYRKQLSVTQADVVLLSHDDAVDCPMTALVVDDIAKAFLSLVYLFEEKIEAPSGIHPSTVIGDDCQIDSSASIGARCVIGHRVHIGKDTIIEPGTVIGDDVHIGANCLFHANVTLYRRVRIGNAVILHSGAVIGSDGFGNQKHNGRWVKIPQLGAVVIHDDVEVGANTTIDSGAIGDTVIGKGAKLDNLIQIAHNVQIGEHTALAAQVGIAGSTRIGAHCMLAGKVGVVGHVDLCDYVTVLSYTGVSKAINTPGVYCGLSQARPYKEWCKNTARFGKLDSMYRRLSKIEKTLEKVDENDCIGS